MNYNKIFVAGRLGRDPQIKQSQSGLPLASFSVAVDKNTRLPDGSWDKKTSWFNVTAFGKTVETVQRCNLRKGSSVFVEGAMESYQKQDGTTGWSLNAFTVQSLDPRPAQGEYGQQNFSQNPFNGYPAQPSMPQQTPPQAQQGFQQQAPAPQQQQQYGQQQAQQGLDMNGVNPDVVPF